MPPRRRSVLLTQLVIDAPGSPQQTILDELRRVILSGSAPPGTPIPLGDVADVFGVSRIPVRESLKTLVGESLVDHRHQFGYTVAQLTPAELREMYIVRETLESAALAVAVEQATEEDHEHAVEVNSRLEIALRYDDSQSYHCESRNFHLALTRPSQMLRLL
ncbi:MAG: GntR family transcriptional regulator, partial [Rhodococcus sp. (in: high G+C Gram-positive bacteria)]